MAAVSGAFITAAAAYAGDEMASAGQQSANLMNANIAGKNNAFNARQAAAQRQFAQKESVQAEWFSKEMADTQMERRVEDLRRAGLNPALAYQLGGAAAPSGVAPSGSAASSAGNPSMQNTGAAYANLGNQANSALTQKAQVDLLQAQANKANAEAGVEIPAAVDNLKSMTGLNDMRAQEAYKNVQLIEASLEPPDSSDRSIAHMKADADLQLQQVKVAIGNMDVQTQQDTLSTLIQARNSENKAASINADNIFNASSGDWGKLMAFFSLISPGVHTAGNVAGNVAEAITP